MKKLLIGLTLGAFLTAAQASEVHWMTSLPKAIAKAKANKKMVVIDFTGSDWCPFCIKLDKEVLKSATFDKYAKKNLVMVMADFPRHKELSAAQRKANQALAEKYQIRGFPTLVFLNSNGKEVGRKVGYGGGGPESVIKKIKAAEKK